MRLRAAILVIVPEERTCTRNGERGSSAGRDEEAIRAAAVDDERESMAGESASPKFRAVADC